MRHDTEKRRLAHERAVRRGKRSQQVQREKRMALGPREDERPRRQPGAFIGVLQFHGADGVVRRWTIRQAKRRNSVVVGGAAKAHGFDWLTQHLRAHLAQLTR